MSSSIRVSKHLFETAARKGKIEHRSAAKQIEYWAEIGRCIERQTGLTAMDLLKISAGAKIVKIVERDVYAISSATTLDLIETDKNSDSFKREIMKTGPVYQRCLTNPDFLEQIHSDGSIKIGNFIDGNFVEKK